MMPIRFTGVSEPLKNKTKRSIATKPARTKYIGTKTHTVCTYKDKANTFKATPKLIFSFPSTAGSIIIFVNRLILNIT